MSEDNFLKKSLPVLLGLLVLVITIAAIQGVSYIFDLLRTKTGVPISKVENSYLESGNISVQNTEKIEKNIEEIKKQISPYDYKDTLKKMNIISNFKNTVKDGKQTDNFNKELVINGELIEGYLYIRASVDREPLTDHDDIYFKIGGTVDGEWKESGGHLIGSKSLVVPDSSNKFTELLYNLNDIKYKRSYNDTNMEVISGDWLNLLNKGNTHVVIAFSSTQRAGEIEEANFYYKCLGDSNCEIE